MRTLVTCLALVGFQAAWAQDFEKTCLMEGDAGNGLSLVVDGRGDIHLSRIFRVLGELNYTRIDREGVAANEELASFVSLLGVDEADNTDLLLEGDAPRICYYNAGLPGFEVALLEADGWHRELIQAGVGAGRWCTLLRQGGNLITVFGSDDGILRSARRVRRDDWVIEEIDRVADLAVGREASATLIEGRIVVAHRTGRNQLRVSWQGPDGYAHQTLQDVALGAGVSPVAVNSGGEQLWVVHGIVSPPGTSDGGLVLAQGTRGALRSQLVDMAEVGGAIGAAALGRRLTVVTRYYRRNAIFGSADGLRFYENLTQLAQAERLEEHGSAFQRHVYGPIQVAADPFGMPVIAALDEAEPFGDDRGSAEVCIWRPTDTDRDGLPDAVEERFGTDVLNADTDGDGRSDGEEVLVDRTNPAGDGPLDPEELPDAGLPPPDAGAPPQDAGAPPPDAGSPADAAVVDAARDDAGAPRDAGRDAGSPGDAGLPIDAATSDAGPRPDATPRDAAASDQGRADMRLRDAAPVDAEWPPRADRGADATADPAGGGGGDDGCRATPGRDAGGGALLALLALLLRRRRRFSSR